MRRLAVDQLDDLGSDGDFDRGFVLGSLRIQRGIRHIDDGFVLDDRDVVVRRLAVDQLDGLGSDGDFDRGFVLASLRIQRGIRHIDDGFVLDDRDVVVRCPFDDCDRIYGRGEFNRRFDSGSRLEVEDRHIALVRRSLGEGRRQLRHRPGRLRVRQSPPP